MTRTTGRPTWIYVLARVASPWAASIWCSSSAATKAGYSMLDHRRERAALAERLAEEQGASDELRRQLAIAETAGDIDRATYSQVESTLGELQAQIQAQEEELVFYRGIVSPQDGVAGLRIQSLEVLPSDGERRYLLRLLLVQAIVHSRRVSGAVKLQLEGIQGRSNGVVRRCGARHAGRAL